MLAQRLRRWPNINTSLFQRVVFAGLLLKVSHKDLFMHTAICHAHITIQLPLLPHDRETSFLLVFMQDKDK